MENPLGTIMEIEKLNATEGNPVVQKIVNYKQDGPFKVQQLTNLLFGLQVCISVVALFPIVCSFFHSLYLSSLLLPLSVFICKWFEWKTELL